LSSILNVKTVKDSLSTKDAATYLNSFEAFVYGDMIMFVRCSQSVVSDSMLTDFAYKIM